MRTPRRIALLSVGAAAAAGVYFLFQMWYWQSYRGGVLQAELGFSVGSPYVRCGATEREVLAVEYVRPEGVFAKAGFRGGDIPRDQGFNRLWRVLHQGRGGEVEIDVVDGGDGPALDERRVRRLKFGVPAAK